MFCGVAVTAQCQSRAGDFNLLETQNIAFSSLCLCIKVTALTLR